MKACKYYIDHTSRRITFEYALIQGVNDSIEDAQALAETIHGMNCHVNLIPLNPIQGYEGQGTNPEQANAFFEELTRQHIQCTIRLRRGIEIQAGCGQLVVDTKSSH
jgi:23S rRNA (adenine2503-C2)-methyltransferase